MVDRHIDASLRKREDPDGKIEESRKSEASPSSVVRTGKGSVRLETWSVRAYPDPR